MIASCPGVAVVAWWILSVMALVQPSNQVLAWTTTTTTIHRPVSVTRTTGTTTASTTTTRLYMFDWLQQRKPTPRPDPDTNDAPHHNPDNHDHNDNNPFKKTEDFFANWFQGLSGSSSHGKPSTEEHHQEEDSIHTTTTTTSSTAATTTTANSAVHREPTTTSTSHQHPIISVITDDVEAMTHPTIADTPIIVHATTTAATTTSSSTPVARGGSDDEDIPPATRIHSGHVGWFDHTKGYGFLVLDDNIHETSSVAGTQEQQDIFVHYSAIYTPTTTHDEQAYGVFRKLKRNEPVEFQLATTKDGKIKASHVTGPKGVPVRYVQEQMDKKELTE